MASVATILFTGRIYGLFQIKWLLIASILIFEIGECHLRSRAQFGRPDLWTCHRRHWRRRHVSRVSYVREKAALMLTREQSPELLFCVCHQLGGRPLQRNLRSSLGKTVPHPMRAC